MTERTPRSSLPGSLAAADEALTSPSTVYLPSDLAGVMIAPGSGVVGTPDGAGRVLVDFEGNLNRVSNMVNFADRVMHAHGRHATRYPTVARALLREDEVVAVGVYDPHEGTVTIAREHREKVARWLNVPVADLDAQLATASSARHDLLRSIRTGLASRDPKQKWAAQWAAQRYNITP